MNFGNKHTAPAFARKSLFWHIEGGFSSENPADDLRGMGELGLQCLLFFVETYPGESKMMKRSRGGYPFVKAAMAIARALCEVLRIVDEDGHSGIFPVTRTLYWQILESETTFYQLFSLLFLLFDELFCEEVAKKWSLQDEIVCSTSVVAQLVDAAKARLLRELVKAPFGIDDLRGLCSNAHHVLLKTSDLNTSVCSGGNQKKSSGATTQTSSPPSLWKKHETPRKTMREAGKYWRVDGKPRRTAEECLERLRPRQPEISFSPPESNDTISMEDEEKEEGLLPSCQQEPESKVDLFKGLVLTKAWPTAAVSPLPSSSSSPPIVKSEMRIHERGLAATTS